MTKTLPLLLATLLPLLAQAGTAGNSFQVTATFTSACTVPTATAPARAARRR